jgi:hypothetical protein
MVTSVNPEIMKAFYFGDLYTKFINEIEVSPGEDMDTSLTIEEKISFQLSTLSNS